MKSERQDPEESAPDEADPAPDQTGPFTIGDMSAAIGYDVRDLIVAGYSWAQVFEVVGGRMTLEELFRQAPDNEPEQI